MVPVETIKTAFLGYQKSSVCSYVAQMNEEFAQRLRQTEEEYQQQMEQLQERLRAAQEEYHKTLAGPRRAVPYRRLPGPGRAG